MNKLVKFRFKEKIGFLPFQLLRVCLEDYFYGGSLKYSSGPILNYAFLFFASSLGLLMGVLCIHNAGLVKM